MVKDNLQIPLIKYLLNSLLLLSLIVGLTACGDQPVNNPHRSKDAKANVRYGVFTERPKTLDPARSYSANEAIFTGQIYEPPLQYHYLKRPYQLVPLTAETIPVPIYLDKNGHALPENAPAKEVAYSVYNIAIKSGMYYQPHPALAKDKQGQYRYLHLTQQQAGKYNTLSQFKHTGTREVTAKDYVYEIKRLASPKTQSPIAGLMSHYILGFTAYMKTLDKAFKEAKQHGKHFVNLCNYPLAGAKVIDKYHYQIVLKGKYPQFIYWLAMPFFAPIPWQADAFYSQPGLAKNNISFDWYPIGSGPYMLTVNNPNSKMVLEENPNFHGEKYPTEGMPGDKAKGLLVDAGKQLPFVKRYVFTLEKESLPMWNKFLQGYYDQSGISSDSFDQAIQVDSKGNPHLTAEMKAKHIRLLTTVEPSLFYFGFNMLDPVVGGKSERARKLRQAISIALDYEEFISIFLNGRGVAAQGPLPPGIFGHQSGKSGYNKDIYRLRNGRLERRSIREARKLLAEAGYRHGINPKTGKPLVLHYDAVVSGDPAQKAQFSWLRKQLNKLGIQLDIRTSQYNQFQQKLRLGNTQMFMFGWNADYPDPENFMFLLYGPNSKVKKGGENSTNYSNKEFDELFLQMKDLPNGPERLAVIKKMVTIVRHDAPAVWGFYPKQFVLTHEWNRISKPLSIGTNTLKYARLNPNQRAQKRNLWNKPLWWPLWALAIIIVFLIIPVLVNYWRREHKTKKHITK